MREIPRREGGNRSVGGLGLLTRRAPPSARASPRGPSSFRQAHVPSHALREARDARRSAQRRRSSPLLFKTTLRGTAAPFAAALCQRSRIARVCQPTKVSPRRRRLVTGFLVAIGSRRTRPAILGSSSRNATPPIRNFRFKSANRRRGKTGLEPARGTDRWPPVTSPFPGSALYVHERRA